MLRTHHYLACARAHRRRELVERQVAAAPGVDVLARIAAALGTRTWELFFDGNAMIDIN